MLSRRNFLAGTLAIGAASRLHAQAATPRRAADERRDIEVNGKIASMLRIRQPMEPSDYHRVGKPFRVRVENHIEEPSLIHWHGLTPPGSKMGSGISDPRFRREAAPTMISFTCRGTYWMHSHYGFQEQLLLAARSSSGMAARHPAGRHRHRARRFQLHAAGEDLCGSSGPSAPKMDMPGMKSKQDLNDVQYDAFLANGRTSRIQR